MSLILRKMASRIGWLLVVALLISHCVTLGFQPLTRTTRLPSSSQTCLCASTTNTSSTPIPSRIRTRPIRRRPSTAAASDVLSDDAEHPRLTNLDPTLLSNTTFREVPHLHPSLIRALTEDLKLERLTEIQARVWSAAVQGQSVIGRARTGTGKTLAFLLPSLQRLLLDDAKFRPGRSVALLIVAPTRELVQQIADVADVLCRHAHMNQNNNCVQAMYGGTRLGRDTAAWRRGQWPVVLVSTPGRLLDHLRETRIRGRKFDLSEIRTLVLDETDSLVEGFWKDTRTILSHLPRAEKRQTLLFSATIPPRMQRGLDAMLPSEYERIDCVSGGQSNQQVEQRFLVLDSMEEYVSTLIRLLRQAMTENPTRYKLVVFFPTTKLARFFAAYCQVVLALNGVWEMHSRQSQASRARVSAAFRQAPRGILLTSDVSARGMDYPDVTTVIQYGAPHSHRLYWHRLGRTARAGKAGAGLQVLLPFERNARQLSSSNAVLSSLSLPELTTDDEAQMAQGRHWIGSGHAVLTPRACAAYLSLVAYYHEYARKDLSRQTITAAAEQFGDSVGLYHNKPELPTELQVQLEKFR